MITYNELKEKCTCWTGYKRKPGTKPCAEGSCVKEETEKHHAMAFGRMNPITSGHEAVVNKLHSVAKEHNASHKLIVSHSQDAKKNPLTASQKVAHAKHAFPGTKVTAATKESPTILHHAADAHAAGATHLHVVAGSDRHEEMHNLLHKYNGQHAAHGHYNFKKITVHSSGERDPDSEGTTGISASKMREHAASGNKKEFHKGAPSKMSPEHKDAMYNDVRKGMNIKEEYTPAPAKKPRKPAGFGKDGWGTKLNQLIKKELEQNSSKAPVAPVPDRKYIKGTPEHTAHKATKKPINGHPTNVKEEIESIEEMDGKTVRSYMKKAKIQLGNIEVSQRNGNPEFGKEKARRRANTLNKIADKTDSRAVRDNLHKATAFVKESAMYNIPNDDRVDKTGIAYNPHRKEKTAADLARIEAAKKRGEKETGLYKKQSPAQRKSTVTDLMKLVKHIGEETMDQQADRAMQLKRFKDHMTQANGPQIDTEIALDKKEKQAMLGKIKVKKTPTGLSKDAQEALHDVNEVLRPEMGAGTYINDFIKSTNPRFNNKSKEERRRMAIGAYMAAKAKGVKEEVELEEGTFKYHMDKAIAADAKGDAKKKEYHLGNAKAARYAMKTADYSKHKDLFDKYNKMCESVDLEEARGLADKYWSIAQDRKETADENKGNHETYHTHMGDYHDHMSRYHEELGQHSHAQAHADKAEIHHEKSMQRPKTVKEGTMQTNGTDKIDTQTSAPTASTAKDTTPGKKIKGFKFFNGASEQIKESALETFRAEADARAKKHDEIEAKRKKAAEEGKENMSAAIDALSKQVKEGWHQKPASAYRRPADHHYQVTYYDKSGKADDSSKRFAEKEKAEAHAAKGNAINKVGGSYRVHKVGSPIDEASTPQKGVNVDNVNAAGQEPHEEKWEPAKKKTKLKKEETMKTYKEFLQSLDEVKMADLPSRKIQGKSYGADYTDPEGADDADDKKPAKAAGRKAGQSVGTYKRRQPKAAC